MLQGFIRFDDDSNSSKSVEARCKNRCGRVVAEGYTRLLKLHEFCCQECSKTRGTSHALTCKNGMEKELTSESTSMGSEAPPIITSDAVLLRLSQLMTQPPKMDRDMDAVLARAIFTEICHVNNLPTLDDKHFLLLFSRFSRGALITPASSRGFFYAVFKKIYSYIQVDIPNDLRVTRYFFVLKNMKVSKYYRFKAVIGQGSFGIVHRVIHIVSGHERVCKSIAKGSVSIPASQLETEIRIIAELDHPNVVRMFEYFEDDNHVHLILENCRNGDLLGMIKDATKTRKPIPINFVQSIMQQILSALTFMSSHRIIHKDLKPENIMLIKGLGSMDPPLVKIIDFGLSEMFSIDQTLSSTVAGTAFYMAPEIFRPPFTYNCDVWSCGIMAFFMLTGFLPFFGATVGEVKSNVLYRRLQWPTKFAGTNQELDLPEAAKDFVERLLEKDYKLRIDANDALRHDWLQVVAYGNGKLSISVALNMRSFSKYTLLKRSVINLIAHVWEFDELDSIRDVFRALDRYSRGYVVVGELAHTLTLAGMGLKDAWKTSRAMDLSGTEKLTFTAITAGCVSPLLHGNSRITRTAFQVFGPDKKGMISAYSMWEVLMGYRCPGKSSTSTRAQFSDFARIVAKEIQVEVSGLSVSKSQGIPGKSSSFTAISESSNFQITFNAFQTWLLALPATD